MGFLADPVKSVSDTVSHVGQVVSSSPLAQAVITVGAATMGVPPAVTAGLLGANTTAQTGNIGAGIAAGGLSYLGGTGVNNYMSTGSVFGPGGTTAATATATEQGAAQALISQGYSPTAAWEAVNAGTAGVASTTGAGAAAAGGLGGLLTQGATSPNLLSTGLNMAGSYITGQAATGAAQTQADAQIRAAQIAADAAKFRPVGVTTNFGRSQFGYDANGNLNSAGYALSPQLQGQQNQLMGASQGMLDQFTGAKAATAPMGQAAQSMMTLGNGYLATDPRAQAAKYYADQQAILAPQRATDMAALQAQMQAQGRGGFAIGGGVGGQGAANPQLQAMLNAQMQQDTQLSANATQGGMDYATYGANMVGQGGNMLSGMYGVQNSAYQPYGTAISGANTLENMGQGAMNLGTSLGNTTTAASAAAGNATANGINNAAATMAPANAYSPWGAMLSGAGQATAGYKFDPMTGKAL
jgi:hypothetical protein